jgi:TolB-like protein/DNA-binding winged helix-turn-helix (wHTH) protein/Flp pilus assembly protein TadD
MTIQAKQKLKLGNFEIEPEKRRLTRVGGELVPLAHKPFQVLLYLIENRERVVTRDELLEKFWDGHDVYEEALSKCVGTIRKALSDQLENPRFIETRWAEGYRYIGPLELETAQPELPIQEIKQSIRVKVLAETDKTQDPLPSLENQTEIPAQPDSPDQTNFSRRKVIIAVICVALAVCALFFLWRYRVGSVKNSPEPIRSIAVLPLKNLTGDSEQDYFADGITESLLTKLSKIEGLKVIKLGSMLTYKNKEVDPKTVGQQLDVETVLEGSVRRSGETVRVDVRLVSAKDSSIIWSGDYEHFMRDIFTLQDEIARRTVDELRGKLSKKEEQMLARRYTENVEAYQLYTKGRFFWNKRSSSDFKKAIEYFEQAIALDQNYALAYSGLADCYILQVSNVIDPQRENLQKAKATATKALELDPELSEAHTSLAKLVWLYEWNWTAAETGFKRAIELNPNYETAHHWYGIFLSSMGRHEEALVEVKRAQELDPFSISINQDISRAYYHARQYDKAIEQGLKTLELHPNYIPINSWLDMAYAQKGEYDKAVEIRLKALTNRRTDEKYVAELRKAFQAEGWILSQGIGPQSPTS